MTDDGALSAEHIRALRNADSVGFIFRAETSDGEPGSFVQAFKRHDDNDGFGEHDRRVVVPARHKVTTYRAPTGTKAVSAAWSISSAKFAPEWRTFVSLLRAGDVLRMEWVVGNNNPLVDEAGLTKDEFGVTIIRQTASGKDRSMFLLLDTRVDKVGSSAAAVRYGR